MPTGKTAAVGTLYLDGKRLMELDSELPEIEVVPMVKPIGDLHSVPHWRCGRCHCAIVVYEDDPKPSDCPWCGCGIAWEEVSDGKG